MDTESKSIESKAASVEAAVTEGLTHLGVSSDQVRIEVLDEGSRGLLGIGARDAVVRLTLLTPSAAETESAAPAQEIEQLTKPEKPKESAPPAKPELEPAPPSVADTARDTLSELLQLMGIEATVQIRDEKDTPTGDDAPPFILDILGNDLGILIGRRGKTLDALQFMTRLIVSTEVEKWIRLVVDVEKYKTRRAKTLEEQAKRLAERVVLTQQPIALEPMPPNERRVIHVTLRDHPIVTTESVGQGDRRKVTIIPKN